MKIGDDLDNCLEIIIADLSENYSFKFKLKIIKSESLMICMINKHFSDAISRFPFLHPDIHFVWINLFVKIELQFLTRETHKKLTPLYFDKDRFLNLITIKIIHNVYYENKSIMHEEKNIIVFYDA